jgi:hypothetical protein
MSNISFSDAQGLFTKKIVATYSDFLKPKSFGRSFFKEDESDTKEVSIMVQRGYEKVAVDVVRGTEGNRNTFDKSMEKITVPPYFREYFDAVGLDVYDNLLQNAVITPNMFGRFIKAAAEKMAVLTDKIDRNYENQCWQVLETGVVTTDKNGSIDYKRKAASLVNIPGINANRAWTVANNATTTPYADFEAGCTFIRTVGKTSSSVFNAILGSDALANFLALPQVQSRNDIKNISLDVINAPQQTSIGGVLHGEISAGPYRIRLWSYPEYRDVNGTSTPYVNPKKVILLPENPALLLCYAAVPQLITPGAAPMRGKFHFADYREERMHSHIFDVRSAGVAVPVGVDQIYTMQVIS